MLVRHLNNQPRIDPSACVAPGAIVSGNVSIGEGSRILHGAVVVAEGGTLEIGRCCIVMQNAVVRSTERHSTTIADNCLVGPGAHVVGCTVERNVFIATGASVFHAARLGSDAEVRVNAVVHVNSRLLPHATVPIGWVAVGNPAKILPPGEHQAIWSIQEPLDFPQTVYGIPRPRAGDSIMPQVTRELATVYASHVDDEVLSE